MDVTLCDCEQVDIFSLAMVIYSTLSGEYPYAHLGRTMQRTHAVRQGDRPSLKVSSTAVWTYNCL